MIGYMNGLALTILIGQLPKLFGFSVDANGLIGEAVGFVKGLANGEAVPAAAAVGISGIVLILVLQRWLPKVPGGADHGRAGDRLDDGLRPRRSTASSWSGCCRKGFPPFTIPHVLFDDLGPLFIGALGIALVSLADTISSVVRRSPPGPARRCAATRR